MSIPVDLDREELVIIVRALGNEVAFALRHRVEARTEMDLENRLKDVLRGTRWDEPRALNYGVQSAEAERMAREGALNTLHYECRCDEGAPHEYPCPLSADVLVER